MSYLLTQDLHTVYLAFCKMKEKKRKMYDQKTYLLKNVPKEIALKFISYNKKTSCVRTKCFYP